MQVLCLDLEGVLVPEIWIEFAERTRIPSLRATTRDVPDYDVLMKQRLRILADFRPTHEWVLEPGDLLVLYSDGVQTAEAECASVNRRPSRAS